jgi:hypothetical protein
MQLETITPETIDAWLARSGGSISSRRKSLVLLHGIFRRAQGLRTESQPDRRRREATASAQR